LVQPPPAVTAEAVREDREDRAQVFTPAGPDAPTEVCTPPWAGLDMHAAPVYLPGPAVAADPAGADCEAIEQDAEPVPAAATEPAPPLDADYRALPQLREAVYAACAAGWRGIGVRGAVLVTPVPDYGLDRFAVPAEPDGEDIGALFDAAALRAEAGFYRADRVFHGADTAGFRAVTP
jgi:hypothetical protein